MASSSSVMRSSCHKYTVLLVGTVLCLLISSADSECQGPNGPPGPTGSPGSQGAGTSDTWHDVTPVRNWRQCTFDRLNNGADSGAIATCQFFKESSSTTLFALWGGVTRLYGCHGCCCRWFFTFDSSECSDPEKIEGTVYMAHYTGANLHRHRTIQGYCDGISSGWVDVTLNVGTCSGYGSYDCYTGWNSVSRIIVEEVPASPYG